MADTAARPPRTLKEPVGWSVSIFAVTEGPSWGVPKTGVTGRKRRTAFHASLHVGRTRDDDVAHQSSLAEVHLAC